MESELKLLREEDRKRRRDYASTAQLDSYGVEHVLRAFKEQFVIQK